MDITLILLIIGLISIVASFFTKNFSTKYADELERVSISLHEETSSLKKRIKVVEEELMISSNQLPLGNKGNPVPKVKPVHDIIVNQILSLHSQGYSINDIAKRSTLSKEDVITVLQSKGVRA
ncbi:hypothetical protein [Sporosarcina sp. NPDC096371]|uniref:hypothetical protein n=1 Tax=Sporosarcina sp. NPDC096371 TaxID=3364530 RepID=UPI00380F5DA8